MEGNPGEKWRLARWGGCWGWIRGCTAAADTRLYLAPTFSMLHGEGRGERGCYSSPLPLAFTFPTLSMAGVIFIAVVQIKTVSAGLSTATLFTQPHNVG